MFDRRNHFYEGYEKARMKGVPLTELYATAYNTWISDSSMTLRESEELEVYMRYLADTITIHAMMDDGYDLVSIDEETSCFVKK